MKNLIVLIVLSSLTAGCYGSRFAQMNDRMAKLEQENTSLKRQNARLQGSGNEAVRPLIDVPSEAPAAPVQERDAVVWRERPHGAYVCIADYDAHLSQAPKFHFVNKVDDRYGMVSSKTKRNSFLSIEMNGQPVVVWKGNGRSLFLGPDESCYLEKGGSDQYKIRAKLYRNVGGRQAPVLDREPDGLMASSALPLFEGAYPLHSDYVTFEFRSQHFSR